MDSIARATSPTVLMAFQKTSKWTESKVGISNISIGSLIIGLCILCCRAKILGKFDNSKIDEKLIEQLILFKGMEIDDVNMNGIDDLFADAGDWDSKLHTSFLTFHSK